jgi:hypothetical protein
MNASQVEPGKLAQHLLDNLLEGCNALSRALRDVFDKETAA